MWTRPGRGAATSVTSGGKLSARFGGRASEASLRRRARLHCLPHRESTGTGIRVDLDTWTGTAPPLAAVIPLTSVKCVKYLFREAPDTTAVTRRKTSVKKGSAGGEPLASIFAGKHRHVAVSGAPAFNESRAIWCGLSNVCGDIHAGGICSLLHSENVSVFAGCHDRSHLRCWNKSVPKVRKSGPVCERDSICTSLYSKQQLF